MYNIFKRKNYEDVLYKKYGIANKIQKYNLKILFIADTHNCLKPENETLKFIQDNNNPTHDGLKGITEYIYKNHIAMHIHGHLHENKEEILKNGTKSICIYMAKLLEL